jgi:hypothetical protein
MTKRTTSFIAYLFIGFLCIAGAAITIHRDVDLDLKKTNSISGTVSYTGLADKFTRGLKLSKTDRVFKFKLNNSKQNFTVLRSYHDYSDLEINMKIGQTVKIYYHPSSSEYNLSVYQIEKDGKILYDYKEYNKKYSAAGGIMLIAGVLIIIISTIQYTKFNLLKLLMGFTQ